jgi:hypothetical protein
MSTRIRSFFAAVAATAAIATTFASPADAAPRWRSNSGAAVAAGIVGFAAGAAIAGAARPRTYAADPYHNGPVGYYDPGYGYAEPGYGYSEPGYVYDEPTYYRPARPNVDGNYWQRRQRDERDRLGY